MTPLDLCRGLWYQPSSTSNRKCQACRRLGAAHTQSLVLVTVLVSDRQTERLHPAGPLHRVSAGSTSSRANSRAVSALMRCLDGRCRRKRLHSASPRRPFQSWRAVTAWAPIMQSRQTLTLKLVSKVRCQVVLRPDWTAAVILFSISLWLSMCVCVCVLWI